MEKWKKQIREKDEEATIRELAKYFKCGYTVIARRAYDCKFIDFQSYQSFARKVVQQYLEKNKAAPAEVIITILPPAGWIEDFLIYSLEAYQRVEHYILTLFD